jgi:hypothetical protein
MNAAPLIYQVDCVVLSARDLYSHSLFENFGFAPVAVSWLGGRESGNCHYEHRNEVHSYFQGTSE